MPRVTDADGWERMAGDVGGTVGGLASSGSVVFAATAVGVFRSADGGLTWNLLGIRNTVPFAEVVAPSARFEQDRTIFVCAGDGLYRSTDGGDAWQPVLVGSRMLSLANTDADNKSVLLAGTETDGVLRSEDSGRTWSGANAGLLDLTALALALSPNFIQDHLGFAGTASGLYRTRNGARSWRVVETGLSEPAVQCVTCSPDFHHDHLVLAGTESDGLLRSVDAGSTWHRPPALVDEGVTAVAFSTRYPSKQTIAAAIEAGVAISNDGGQTWRMTGSPPGVVLSLMFAATSNGEALLAGLHRHGVARSEDDGASWSLTNAGLSARLLTGLAAAEDGTIFAAGPQDGVNVSADGGRTWVESNSGLGDAAVQGLAVSPAYTSDRTLYVATTDGIHVSHDGAATWARCSGPPAPALTVATAPGSPDGSPTIVLAAGNGGALFVSDDGAATWRASGAAAFDGAEVVALAVSPGYARDRTIFVATTARASAPTSLEGKRGLSPTETAREVVLWRSVGGGARWERWLVEHQAATGASFIALAVSPAYSIDELVFVGLAARILTRAGAGWRVTDLGSGTSAVTSVAVSPAFADDRTVFVATNAGVFVTRDGGASYQPWSDCLVPPGMVAVAVSPNYPNDRLVYALGLGGTIWRRQDRVS